MLNKEKSRLFAVKKTIAILFIIVFATSMIFAQGALPKKGDLFIGGKLALVGTGTYTSDIGFVVNAEMVTREDFLNLGDIPASLGFGAMFGYSGGDHSMYWNFSRIMIMGSAYYHADVLKNDKIDTYVVVNLGFDIYTWKWDGVSGILNDSRDTDVDLSFNSAVGARYFITNNLALVGEFGWGIGLIRIGVDLKLGK